MPTDAQNHRPRFALWHHCLLMLFFFLHLLGLHRNVKEILIAVIPNRSTFKQWDICSPSLRDHSKKKKKKKCVSFFIHPLSFFSPVFCHLAPLFSYSLSTASDPGFDSLILFFFPLFPFSDVCLHGLVYLQLPPPPPPPPSAPPPAPPPQGWNVPDSGVIVIKCVLSLLHKALMRGGDQRHGASSPQ